LSLSLSLSLYIHPSIPEAERIWLRSPSISHCCVALLQDDTRPCPVFAAGVDLRHHTGRHEISRKSMT
uniref:Uncharacterized protein n=1 Tax=Seriola lalandi dorsalis TaxID=1841481 RepID=A0A3B4XLH5_SERLL